MRQFHCLRWARRCIGGRLSCSESPPCEFVCLSLCVFVLVCVCVCLFVFLCVYV